MKIELNPAAQATTLQESAGAGKPARIASQATASFAADSVALSSSSQRVAALSAQALAAPEVRQQRVAALAAAVSDGSYQVSAEQIATAIFDQLRRA